MPEKLRDSINRGNINSLADVVRYLKAGNVFTGFRRHVFAQALVANVLVLPAAAKAKRVLSVYARAGSGTLGPLALGTVPNAGEYLVNTTGDLVFNATDAWTSVDAEYDPVLAEESAIDQVQVVTNVLTIPTTARPCEMLLSVTGFTVAGVGTTKAILALGSSPTAGQCAMNTAKTTITFAAADAVVKASATFLKAPSVELGAALEATSTYL